MIDASRPRGAPCFPANGLLLVLGAAALLLFARLGGTDFWPPDEPRQGAIAEEMRSFAHGWRGLVLPHLNGNVYTQKPPLFYWIAALVGSLPGRVTETAARLPSAVAAWCTALLVCQLGRLMFRPRVGILAGAVLMTVPGFVWMGRSARLDALLTLFVTLAFVASYRLDRGLGSVRANRWWLHASIGLGVLVKGPVALLFPLFGLLAYLAWERRLRDVSRFVSMPCLLASLGPGLVWLAGAAALGPSNFFAASFSENLFGRFFSGTSHTEPWWFYFARFPRGFLPWTLLWPLCLLRCRALSRDGARPAAPGSEAVREAYRAWRFLLASIGAAFVFFSLSAGKRGVYLLPLHPLAALACADALASWLDSSGAAERTRTRLATAAILALAVGELAAFVFVFPAMNARNSPRAIAEAAAAETPEGAEVGLFRDAQLTGAVLYYGRRPVRPLRDAAAAARFVAEGGHTIVVEDEDLPRLGGPSRYRVLARARSRQRRFLVVAPTGSAPGAPR